MINVGEKALSLDDFSDILFKGKAVVLDKKAIEKVKVNFEFLKQFSSNKLIYGRSRRRSSPPCRRAAPTART